MVLMFPNSQDLVMKSTDRCIKTANYITSISLQSLKNELPLLLVEVMKVPYCQCTNAVIVLKL